MLIDDEQFLLSEMEENRSIMNSLENELQVIRGKPAFIKRAAPENIQISIYK